MIFASTSSPITASLIKSVYPSAFPIPEPSWLISSIFTVTTSFFLNSISASFHPYDFYGLHWPKKGVASAQWLSAAPLFIISQAVLCCPAGLRGQKYYLSSYSSQPLFLRFDSNSRLYPSHSLLSPAARKISVKVSILASVLSARFSATASARAGFFGEPYSSSP